MAVPARFRPHRRISLFLRFGKRLHDRGFPRAALLVDLATRIVFSADIPCRLDLPDGVVFMHNGLGTVVDEKVVFTGPAVVFQHVTLGHAHDRGGGVPTIGSDVVLGAGAGVFGPVRVGDNCRVGANAVVTADVPDSHRVRPAPVLVEASRSAAASKDERDSTNRA